MLEFMSNINPIVIDVILIAIIVLATFFGFIRGIKHNLINFTFVVISMFLGFCTYTVSMKQILLDKVLKVDMITPPGSNNVFIFMTSLFMQVLASFAISLLFYLVLLSIKTLISILLKKKRREDGKRKTKKSRLISSFFSFLYASLLAIVVLLSLNTNIVGMKPFIQKSTVSKFVVNNSEKLLNKIDDNLTKRIIIKVYCGDVLYKASDKLLTSFDYLNENASKMINDKKYNKALDTNNITEEQAKELIKERLVDLYHISVVADVCNETNKNVNYNFNKVSEEWLGQMHRKIKNSNLPLVELSKDQYEEIKKSLSEAGSTKETMKLYDEIFVSK